MLPSTSTMNSSPLHQQQAPVVFRVVHLSGGAWSLAKSGGDVGGLFRSKHAALSYACGEAELCRARSVLIELEEPAETVPSND